MQIPLPLAFPYAAFPLDVRVPVTFLFRKIFSSGDTKGRFRPFLNGIQEWYDRLPREMQNAIMNDGLEVILRTGWLNGTVKLLHDRRGFFFENFRQIAEWNFYLSQRQYVDVWVYEQNGRFVFVLDEHDIPSHLL